MIKKLVLNILKGLNKSTNKVDWKNLRSLTPVSDVFGYDRGNQSVHRFYIDQFIESKSEMISGSVLEVGERMYSGRFSEKVTNSSILVYQQQGDEYSLDADLTKPETLPLNAFDCFICTQTFNFIYDFQTAIKASHRLLKSDGFLLATVSGIQQISTFDATRWGDYWRFTEQSAMRAFADVFGKENIEVICFGNVLASVAAIEGMTSSEITLDELNYRDSAYPLIIGIVARKK